jgi:hypothetical protein
MTQPCNEDRRLSNLDRRFTAFVIRQAKADLRKLIDKSVHIPDSVATAPPDIRRRDGTLLAVSRAYATVDYGPPVGRWKIPWHLIAKTGSEVTVAYAHGIREKGADAE